MDAHSLIRRLGCVVFLGLIAAASSARAQGYAFTPGSYVPLGSSGHAIIDPSVGLDAYNKNRVSGTVTGTDNGVAILTLGGGSPWSFQFGGVSYSQIAVSVDGFIALQGTQGNCGCLSDLDPNATPACSAPFTSCPAAGCGPGVAGAAGCCVVANACSGAICEANPSCGGSCCTSCGPTAPNFQPFGGAISPSVIAGWMEDLDDTASKGIGYLEGTDTYGAHFIVIDYHGVQSSQAGGGANACFGCSGDTAYNFSITLYQPTGSDGIATVSYGAAATVPGGADDTCQAFVGAADEAFNPAIIPTLTETQNFNNNCFNTQCDAVNTDGCQFSCGSWPLDSTLVFYDTAVPSNALAVPAAVQVINPTYSPGGGFPNLTFGLGTTVNNLGGTSLGGTSLGYDVYLSKTPISGLDCSGVGCLGSFTQNVAAGTLGKFTAKNDGSGVVLGAGVSVTTPSTLTVGIPPTLGKGIYYAQMTFGGGSAVESAVSAPLEFGADPAAVAVNSVPPLPKPNGTFSVNARVENIGFVQEAAFSMSLYLAKGGCGTFDPAKAPFLGKFNAGPLAALSGPTDFPLVTLAPVMPPGLDLQAGNYFVAMVVSSIDDLNLTNNLVCSAVQIAISPPALKTTNVLAPPLCYVAQAAGGPHYACDVPYSVTNNGTELAIGFNMGVYAEPFIKGPSVNPRLAAQMYFPDCSVNCPVGVNFTHGVWGPITLGGGCTMNVSGFGQIVNFNPPGCGIAAGVGTTPGALPPPIALPQEFPNTTVFGDMHNPVPADYQIVVVADPDGQIPGSTAGHQKAAANKTVVAFAGPDLTVFAGDLGAPETATAGEPMLVNKTIRNVGPIAGSAPYAYYLSSVGIVGTNGVPVPVILPSGELTYLPTTALLQPSSNAGNNAADRDRIADTLLLPGGLATGNYTLTIAVDPLAATPEVHRNNKLQYAGPIAIAASPIQVLNTNLPVGVVGEQYPTVQLSATGGFDPYVWSVVTGDLSQSGLMLSPAGVISGTPTQAGDFSFAVQVKSGSLTQVVALFLTVTTASGPLQITSPALLPPATVGQYYSQQIQAQGGVPPYRWSGTAPGGLTLDPSGLLVGTPSTPTNAPIAFSVTVTDSVGNQVSGTLSVSVVAAAAIVISTDPNCQALLTAGKDCGASVPPLAPGASFLQAFYAFEQDGQPHGYTWSLAVGQPLPAGVEPPVQQGQAFVLTGTPTQVGIFPFSLVATDELGRTASRQFALVVTATPFTGGLVKLPDAAPGAVYGPVKLTSEQAMTPVVWSLYSGELPPGINVGSDGSIAGTVPSNATPRTYSFVAAVETEGGGLALLPAAIDVVAPLVAKSGGCQSAGGDASLAALALGLLWIARGRRKSTLRAP